MSEIKLAGFIIMEYTNEVPIYILPIYNFTCPCNFLHHIAWNNGLNKIFHPKYLNKIKTLAKEKTKFSDYFELVPYITIEEQVLPCEHLAGETNCINNFSGYRRREQGGMMNEFQSELKNVDHLKFGAHLSTFIVDYWAAANYGWYILRQPKFNLRFDQKKIFLRGAFETDFLTIAQGNIYRLEREIKSSVVDIIPIDLIKIIYSYSYSPTDIMGKIISIVQKDILRYGEIIAGEEFVDENAAYCEGIRPALLERL
ncbi:MAG: hypothetical protein Hyperionvirus5_5 [Hyperionvirus sp.]|uniref:Uncharacterized protein n=1 Tax=Hyperionvirus sp. TaxID=2487770 RepID=A0A3G5ACW9_9VIRU|nr:MAG: hypothetical protein Hyperionvirus5_5 [Hyperionvirus sp.]